MDKKRTRATINEVYKNSGLGRWFHDQSAGGEPGWDRYNTQGEKVGKCGDSKPGEGKPKCLSRQKASKLRKQGGKAAIAAAVRRKRKEDPVQDRPGTGNKPKMVSNKIEDSYMNVKELEIGMTVIFENTICFVEYISRVGDSTYKVNYINEHGDRGHEFVLKQDQIEVLPNDLQEEKAESKRKLNKPFRTPGGPKKFSVYVRNERGNVVKVNFGDPNMEIKRDDPNRRKNFRARHNCGNPGPKTKARYWSCYQWRGSAPVADGVELDGNILYERMDPTKHVEKHAGKYHVKNKDGKTVKIFDDQKEANIYARKNHDKLMEEKDHEYSMARSQLDTAIKAAKKLKSKFKGEGNIEAWVQSKITKAADYLDAASDYVDSDEHDIEESNDCGCEELVEKNVPTSKEKWNSCISQAKAKFDVYPSAYANAWASKCYKKKGGTWRVDEGYLNTKRMDKNEKECHDMVTKELENTNAFKTINPRFKKDIHKEVSKMILIAKDLLTKEKK